MRAVSHNLAVRRAKPEAGFTLIEIMMAFAILGLLLASIYACWTLVLKSSQIGQEAAAQIQRERVAMRTIKEALEGVMSFQSDPANYAFLVENGDQATLSFAAHLPEAFPRSSRPEWEQFPVRRVEFAIEPSRDRQNYQDRELVLRQTPLLKAMPSDERDYPFVVARNVNKMEVEMWDARRSDWVEEWTRTNELPRMIKVKLEFVRRSPRDPYARAAKHEVVEVLKLPAIMVPAITQGTPQPGAPVGAPPITP
jgi:type II secretion system protein J